MAGGIGIEVGNSAKVKEQFGISDYENSRSNLRPGSFLFALSFGKHARMWNTGHRKETFKLVGTVLF